MAYNKITLNGETKIDLTQDTATAKDVALGKTFHLNSGETAVGTLEISSGGGEARLDGKYLFKVVDYDGSVLKMEYLNTGDTFTMPKIPTHDRLVFQEWASPVEIVDNQIVVENYDLIIGAVYSTKSGQSEFDIELTNGTGLSFTLKMDGTKDWGDGTSDTATSHTYTEYGRYTVKCNGSTITSSSSGGIFGQYSNTNTVPNYSVLAVYLGANVTKVPDYTFKICYALHHVVMPKSITSIGADSFASLTGIYIITIPSSVQSLGNNLCKMSWGIKYAIISHGLKTIGSSLFYNVYGLEHIVLPSTITTSAYQYLFDSCYCLKSCVFLGNSGFYNIFNQCRSLEYIIAYSVGRFNSLGGYCHALKKMDFSKCTSVPACDSSAIPSEVKHLKIIVPDTLYDEWIATTNWSSYADYIYKASEVTD